MKPDITRLCNEINIDLAKNGYKNLRALSGPDGLIQIKVSQGDWRKTHWHLHILIESILKEHDCTYDYTERPFGKFQSGFIYSAVHEIRIEGMECFDTLSRDKVQVMLTPGAAIEPGRKHSKEYPIDEEGNLVRT